MTDMAIGRLVILVLAIGSIGIFQYTEEGATGLLSHSEKKQFVQELEDNGLTIGILDHTPERVTVLSSSDKCDYDELRIDADTGEVTYKCGWGISSVFDVLARHPFRTVNGEWVRHDRKKTLTDLTVIPFRDRVDVLLRQPYYATSGQSGNGGVLTTNFSVTPDQIKISQVYENPWKTLPVCAGIRMKRLDEGEAFFIEKDPAFTELDGNTYWYCSEPGQILESDPVVAVSGHRGGVKVGDRIIHDSGEVSFDFEAVRDTPDGDWYIFEGTLEVVDNSSAWNITVESEKNLDYEVDVWRYGAQEYDSTDCIVSDVTRPNGSVDQIRDCTIETVVVDEFGWQRINDDEFIPVKTPYRVRINKNSVSWYESTEFDIVVTPAKMTVEAAKKDGRGGVLDPAVDPAENELSRWRMDLVLGIDDLNNGSLEPVGTLSNATEFIGGVQVDVNYMTNANTVYRNLTISDDYICPNECSWTGWINFSCSGDTAGRFMGTKESVSFDGIYWRRGEAGETAQLVSQHTSGNTLVDYDNAVNCGEWHYLTGVINSSAMTLYFDGIRNNTAAAPNFHTAADRTSVGGYDDTSSTNDIDLMLSCVRFFNASLDQAQVDLLYNGGVWTCDSLETLTNPPVGGGSGINSSVNLTIDGLSAARIYELGTTMQVFANVSANDTGKSFSPVCIEISEPFYGNLTCGDPGQLINISLDGLRNNTFSDNDLQKTYSASNLFNITIDNRTDLLNVSLNLTGSGSDNVSFYLNSTIPEFVLPGELLGKQNTNQKVRFLGKLYETVNLSFSSKGIKSFSTNISTHHIVLGLVNQSLNFTFNLAGFRVDEGNDLEFSEYFNSTNTTNWPSSNEFINVSQTINGTTLTVWDDFGINRTSLGQSRWQVSSSSDDCSYEEYESGGVDSDFNHTTIRCTSGDIEAQNIVYWTEEFDIRNLSRIDVKGYFGGGCSYSDGEVRGRIVFTDTASVEVMHDDTTTCPGSGTLYKNVSLIRRTGTNTWDVVDSGTNEGGVLVSLPQGSDWYLGFQAVYGHSQGSGSGTGIVTLEEIKLGAVGMNVSLFDNSVYDKFSSVTSVPVDNTANNIVAASIDALDISNPVYGDVNVTYELTNDLINWDVVSLGERTVLSGSGSQLAWRINCTVEDPRDTCLVSEVDVSVAGGAPENVSVDFASDGIVDFFFPGELNESTGPANVTNFSYSMLQYAIDNCAGIPYCDIPVTIATDSAGVAEVLNVNFTREIPQYFLNKSLLESKNTMTVLANFSNGDLTVHNISVDFLGFKNFNITAYYPGNSSHGPSNQTFQITTHYSKFSKAFPLNITSWLFQPKSRTDKNVSANGQQTYLPIRNFTGHAYSSAFNLSFYLNQSFDELINLTFNNTNGSVLDSKRNFVLDTSAQQLCTFTTVGDTCGVWSWIDLNITSSRLSLPVVWAVGICSDCVHTFDWTTNRRIIS